MELKEGEVEIISVYTANTVAARLDVFVAEAAAVSRTQAQKAIVEGRVLLNGKPAPAKTAVRVGDEVSVCFPAPTPYAAMPQAIPLDIVYEDGFIIVINKPQGMVTHPSAGHADGTVVNALLFHCKKLSGVGGEQRPGIVHRLDKDTSGLLVAAKDDATHQNLCKQFEEHSARRSYLALVHGNFKEDGGTVDAPIGRHPIDRQRQAVLPAGQGRRAVTHWRVLERLGAVTLLRLELETGRTHQIRVHMAYIKHPVLGDPLYGGAGRAKPGLAGQALHGFELRLAHPQTHEPLCFTAPPPEWFLRTLRAYGGDPQAIPQE